MTQMVGRFLRILRPVDLQLGGPRCRGPRRGAGRGQFRAALGGFSGSL